MALIRSKRTLAKALVVAVIAGLAACSTHDAPKDYSSSCYGGDPAGMLGLRPRLTIRYTITEKQWPELARVLKTFASKQGLDMFDTGVTKPDFHLFEVSLCSPEGIAIRTHEQVWKQNDDAAANEPLNMSTYLYQYRETFPWRRVGEALVQEFQRHGWKVDVEWFQPRIQVTSLTGEPALLERRISRFKTLM